MSENSEDLQDLYRKYISGACSAEEIKKLYAHFTIAKNEVELRSLIQETLADTSDLEITAYEQIREDVFKGVKEKIGQAQSGRSRSLLLVRWLQRHSIRVAAACLVLALSVPVVWNLKRSVSLEIPEKWEVIATEEGEIKELILPDSSRVWLNGNSELSYRLPFHGDSRELRLAGEAFFEVTRDTLRPFTVLSRDVMTRVLGTSFNVRSMKESKDVLVSVKTGKVKVMKEEYEGILERGREFRYDGNADRINVGDISLAEIGSWKNTGDFHFRNQTIREVVVTLEAHFGVRITYPLAMGDCPVIHADFKSDDSLGKILKILVTPLEGTVLEVNKGEYRLSGDQCF